MSNHFVKYGIGIFVRPPDLSGIFGDDGHPTCVEAPAAVKVQSQKTQFVKEDLHQPCSHAGDEAWEKWEFRYWLLGQCQDFVRVSIPAGTVLAEPVRIRVGDLSYVSIDVGEGSEVSFAEERPSESDGALLVHLHVRAGARATYLSSRPITTRMNERVERRALVESDASVAWREAIMGGERVQSYTVTDLEGDRATASMESVFLGHRSEQFDIKHDFFHSARSTTSDAKMRGVLLDRAKAVQRGLSHIFPQASGCSARQRVDVLLTSPQSEASATPSLMIENDDVRCGHGVAIGRVDQERLFYLMSRGIERWEAERMLMEAHLEPFFKDADERLRFDFSASLGGKMPLP